LSKNPALAARDRKEKRPVRLLVRAASNPKSHENPFGPLGNLELKSETSINPYEPIKLPNSSIRLVKKNHPENPESIHILVENGDNFWFV
jgi:hypothetical protein